LTLSWSSLSSKISIFPEFISKISFIINRNYLTPKINDFRDKELEGDKKASSSFKYIHLLSVLLFILNFIILVSIVIINYFNYNL